MEQDISILRGYRGKFFNFLNMATVNCAVDESTAGSGTVTAIPATTTTVVVPEVKPVVQTQQQAKTGDDDESDPDHEVEAGDSDIVKHLKKKLLRSARRETNLSTARNTAEGELTTTKSQLATIRTENEQLKTKLTTLEAQASVGSKTVEFTKAGIAADRIDDAIKLIDDSFYKEEGTGAEKKRVLDTDKLRESKPYLFSSNPARSGNQQQRGQQGQQQQGSKSWGPQGASSDRKEGASNNEIKSTTRYPGPSSMRNRDKSQNQ